MTEHYTRNTESVSAWCNKCNRVTQYAVSDGRRGRCLEHAAPKETKKAIAAREKREHEARNPRLF